ncbi:hypothetical protein CPB84DRAFT_1310669 [Gymnopilus junonius]|uniref:Uncharacterized protein n=1 Tax=Gymnopilus junonius TaxID=109634 RepID=A0A9P5NJV8_GYMJU|nr:hypothetical protein CPB84DRAFT_1310669 [Gymnopilus junonius]
MDNSSLSTVGAQNAQITPIPRSSTSINTTNTTTGNINGGGDTNARSAEAEADSSQHSSRSKPSSSNSRKSNASEHYALNLGEGSNEQIEHEHEPNEEIRQEQESKLNLPEDEDIPVSGFAVASNKRNADFHELFPNVPEGDYLIGGGCFDSLLFSLSSSVLILFYLFMIVVIEHDTDSFFGGLIWQIMDVHCREKFSFMENCTFQRAMFPSMLIFLDGSRT